MLPRVRTPTPQSVLGFESFSTFSFRTEEGPHAVRPTARPRLPQRHLNERPMSAKGQKRTLVTLSR
jgi:hypothetical protein